MIIEIKHKFIANKRDNLGVAFSHDKEEMVVKEILYFLKQQGFNEDTDNIDKTVLNFQEDGVSNYLKLVNLFKKEDFDLIEMTTTANYNNMSSETVTRRAVFYKEDTEEEEDF